jgi:hypothetical protein
MVQYIYKKVQFVFSEESVLSKSLDLISETQGMKSIIRAFIFLTIIVFISSCTQSYTCGRQCHAFNSGRILICEVSASDPTQFNKSSDSLMTIYGNYTSVFADSVSVGGSSANAISTITNQLEQQGYTCTANAF